MSSFPETKAERLATRGGRGKRFLQYNRRQLSRVYPRGQRLDSSNYDPLPMWICGSQLVALNFQTPGHCLRRNVVLFSLPRDEDDQGHKLPQGGSIPPLTGETNKVFHRTLLAFLHQYNLTG